MIVDHALIRRIEDAIAAERSAFADGMAAEGGQAGVGWAAIAGGRAIFTGRGFFSNRAFAMGLCGPVRREDVEAVEAFYAARGAPSELEIASTVDRSLLGLLGERGYELVRFRNVYAQPLLSRATAGPSRAAGADVHEVDSSNAAAWSSVLLDGFGYTRAADRERVQRWNRMVRSLPSVTALIAMVGERAVGAASVMVIGSAALLGGAATLPAFRRRGVQRALIEARLAVAGRAGCELGIVTADPASSSGRNAERTGFQLIGNHLVLRSPSTRA